MQQVNVTSSCCAPSACAFGVSSTHAIDIDAWTRASRLPRGLPLDSALWNSIGAVVATFAVTLLVTSGPQPTAIGDGQR